MMGSPVWGWRVEEAWWSEWGEWWEHEEGFRFFAGQRLGHPESGGEPYISEKGGNRIDF